MRRLLQLMTVIALASTSLHSAAESPKKRVAPGYLSSGFDEPVMNNYGECWMSGPVPDFKPSPDCLNHPEEPAIAAPEPQPVVAEPPKAEPPAPAPEPVPAPAPAPEPAPVAPPPAPEPTPVVAPPAPVVSAPAPAAQPVKVIRITLSAKTLFDFDKSDLRPEGKRALDDVLVEVAKHSGEVTHITVTGHTDWVGTIVYNQKLSERRANAVRFYLISKGVDASMVSSVGMGKAEPIATNRTAEGRQLNRRAVVEFEIRDTEQ